MSKKGIFISKLAKRNKVFCCRLSAGENNAPDGAFQNWRVRNSNARALCRRIQSVLLWVGDDGEIRARWWQRQPRKLEAARCQAKLYSSRHSNCEPVVLLYRFASGLSPCVLHIQSDRGSPTAQVRNSGASSVGAVSTQLWYVSGSTLVARQKRETQFTYGSCARLRRPGSPVCCCIGPIRRCTSCRHIETGPTRTLQWNCKGLISHTQIAGEYNPNPIYSDLSWEL